MFSQWAPSKKKHLGSSSLPLYQSRMSTSQTSSSFFDSAKSFLLPGASLTASLNDHDDVAASSSDGTSEADPETGVMNGWFRQAEADPCFPKGLSKKQRIVGFFCCLLLGSLFISLALVMLPMLLLKARKFAILYSMGSLCLLASFSMLWGPMNHLKHLFSGSRIVFSAVYLMSLFSTLYVAMALHSVILSIICIVVQLVALVWYCISYIPGGQTGLKFFGKLFYATASKTVNSLPV